jgi:hypothetical protein
MFVSLAQQALGVWPSPAESFTSNFEQCDLEHNTSKETHNGSSKNIMAISLLHGISKG